MKYTVYYRTWWGEHVYCYGLSFDQATSLVEDAEKALRIDVCMFEEK